MHFAILEVHCVITCNKVHTLSKEVHEERLPPPTWNFLHVWSRKVKPSRRRECGHMYMYFLSPCRHVSMEHNTVTSEWL